jgi:DNA-binding response OmpR family regulator
MRMSRAVVLVEDHVPVRQLYATALRAAGWQVLERPSARRLAELVRRAAPEAVVLDWTLPGPSGFEALRALKRDRSLRHVRVIMLSAHAVTSLERAALAQGAERFLHKPLRPDALVDALAAPPSLAPAPRA